MHAQHNYTELKCFQTAEKYTSDGHSHTTEWLGADFTRKEYSWNLEYVIFKPKTHRLSWIFDISKLYFIHVIKTSKA